MFSPPADSEHRHIVGLLRSADEAAHVLPDAGDDLLGGSGAGKTGEAACQTLQPVEISLAVLRLGNAVGEQDQGVPGCSPDVARL